MMERNRVGWGSQHTQYYVWNMGYYRRIIERTGELDRIKKE